MKLRNLLIIALFSTGCLQGAGVSFGPFNFEFSAGFDDSFGPGMRLSGRLYDPICRAITQQKKLQFVSLSREKINDNEIKFTTKIVTVEPYAYGFTKEKQPVLRGAVTEEKLLKEVTVKSGDDMSDDQRDDEGYFAGYFRSPKSQGGVESLDVTKVRDVRVIEDSHFDAPKDLGSIFKEDIAQVVCQVPAQTN
jgi:hypothetical protein